jgi:tetratricopeptide (TPR) repeat protein
MLTMLWVLGSVGAFGAPPSECLALSARAGSNLWERAKAPELGRYCELLASGTAKLANPGHIATDVVEIAEEADALVPGRARPLVLLGRALARLGRYREAAEALAGAKQRDSLALEDAPTLLCWARVLAYTRRVNEALEAYRTLLPRASTLSIADRGVAYVGAGVLVMSVGPPGIEEAVAILREARKNSQDAVLRVAGLALALALDRAGERSQASFLLAERPFENAAAFLGDPAAIESLGPQGLVERPAMIALALERVDPKTAHAAWASYLDGPGGAGAWAGHARLHATTRYSRPERSR